MWLQRMIAADLHLEEDAGYHGHIVRWLRISIVQIECDVRWRIGWAQRRRGRRRWDGGGGPGGCGDGGGGGDGGGDGGGGGKTMVKRSHAQPDGSDASMLMPLLSSGSEFGILMNL